MMLECGKVGSMAIVASMALPSKCVLHILRAVSWFMIANLRYSHAVDIIEEGHWAFHREEGL